MQMRMASVISTCLHIAVLGWATLSFNSKAFEATPPESLPVDIISEKEFSEVTKGVKDAKKPAEKPKPWRYSSRRSFTPWTPRPLLTISPVAPLRWVPKSPSSIWRCAA